MRRIDFPHYIKPLLCTTGLTLLALYVISSVFTVWPPSTLSSPGQALDSVTQLLDLSSLLALALLMLALSLAEYNALKEPLGSEIRIGLRDRTLLRARLLVAAIAISFLLLIPFSLLQAQKLRIIGIKGLENQTAMLKSQLLKASNELASPGIKEQFLPVLMERYSPIIGVDIIKVRSVADLRKQVILSLKELPQKNLVKMSQAEKDLRLRVVRISLFSILYASLSGYICAYWPRISAVLPNRKSIGLGVESEGEIPT